jgi:hypothetical protein
MSFMAEAAPLDFTPSDLNTASLPTQRAANDEGGDSCERQYVISASVMADELHFLIEYLFTGIIVTEEFRF